MLSSTKTVQHRVFIQRQHMILVLQQHDSFPCCLKRNLIVIMICWIFLPSGQSLEFEGLVTERGSV